MPTDTVAHVTAVSGFCILDGRNHGAYVSRFAQDAATLVRNGFWLDPDASEAVSRSANAAVR